MAVSQLPYLTPPVLWYESVLRGVPVRVDDPFGFDGGLSMADFVVMLDASSGRYGAMAMTDPYLRELLKTGRLPFILLGKVSLPDQSEAVLYGRSPTPAPGPPVIDLIERLRSQADAHDAGRYAGHRRPLFGGPGGAYGLWQTPGQDIRIQYLYVPDSGAALQYRAGTVVSDRPADCSRTYEIKAREAAPPYRDILLGTETIGPPHPREPERPSGMISLDAFRGKIIHITLTVRPDSDHGESCNPLYWSDLKMTGSAP